MKLRQLDRVGGYAQRQLVILAVVSSTVAAALASGTDLDTRLRAIDNQAENIRDLTADFTEEKFTVLLKKPMVSKGTVSVIGSRTRWNTMSPHPTTMYTDDEEVVIYFPARKTAELYPIDRRLQPLVVSPIPRVATIRKHFDVEELSEATAGGSPEGASHITLRLIPKKDALAEHIEDVRVRIHTELGIADRVEVVDAEGDRTVITFTNLRTNVGLSESDVHKNLPPGTAKIRPLDGKDTEPPTEARSDAP